MKEIGAILLFLTLIITLTGCINIPIGDGNSLKILKDGLTLSDSDGKDSTINFDKDNESFNISNDDGEEWEGSFGENIAIPEDFPTKDLPIPEKANVISAQKMSLEEGDGSILMYMYEDDIATLAEMYADHFQQNGFEEALLGELFEADYTTISAKKGEKMYIVQILDVGEGHIQVTLMYGKSNENK